MQRTDNDSVRLFLTAIAIVTASLIDVPTAQSPAAPPPPVVRFSRNIPQPQATILAATADAAGNTYVTGYATTGLATTPMSFQPANRGGTYDAFVAKLDAGGTLTWATYLGGSSGTSIAGRIPVPGEMGTAIAVDATGNVYVAGNTISRDFPNVNGFQSASVPSGRTGFVVKLDTTGQHAIYASYVGGAAADNFTVRIVATALGEAYVIGETSASDFGASRHLGVPSTSYRSYAAYIGPTGQRRDAVTFGGTCFDTIGGAAVDAAGELHVAGGTCSKDFPIVAAAQPTCAVIFGNCQTSFVMKFAAGLGPLVYSTYLGDGGNRMIDSFESGAAAVAIDAQGRAVVAGSTGTTSFPVVQPLQSQSSGTDAFVTRFTPAGAVDFSTTLGGAGNDQFDSIRVDATGAIVVSGTSASVDFPLRSPMLEHPDAGVVRSDDAGATWTRVANNAGGQLQRVVVDPVDPQRMYGSWVELVTDPLSGDSQRIALGRSDDGGRTWTRLPEPGPQALSGVFGVGPSRSVYVSNGDTSRQQLRRSDDGGMTWTTSDQGTCCGVGVRDFRSIVFTAADANRVYVGTTFEGVRVSIDRGATWSSRSSGLPPLFSGGSTIPASIDGLVASPVTIGTLWVVIRNMIFKTVDDGLTFTLMFTNIADNSPPLAVSADGATLYGGEVDGVIVSADSGTTWKHVVFGFKNTGNVPRRVFADPQRAGVAYALGLYQTFDVWRTADAGQTWSEITPRQFARVSIMSLIIPATSSETVIGIGPVTAARLLVRLSAAGATPQLETSTFLGTLASSTMMTLAPDGDAILFSSAAIPGAPPGAAYTMTRIGKWYSPFCGRSLAAGVLAPQVDICAP